MLHSQKSVVSFYEHLGKLFYSVAYADGRVHPAEFHKLKEIVTELWLDLDKVSDSYHSDAAYQIEIVFEWLVEKEMDSGECFRAFSNFYKSHPDLFPPKVKNLIKVTARAIAHAFSGKNKAELVQLGKIELLLK